jgi:Subtilase family
LVFIKLLKMKIQSDNLDQTGAAGKNGRSSLRQIIVFPQDFDRQSLSRWRDRSAIHQVAHSGEFRESALIESRTDSAELIFFDRLGIGLLNLKDPAKLKWLKKRGRRHSGVRTVRPETRLGLLDDSQIPTVKSYSSSVAGKSFSDNRRYTWAMQACGLTHSKYNGEGARIAILDTGIDLLHPDWQYRTFSYRSFLNSSIQDEHGHGTQCAGVAAGQSVDAEQPRFGAAPKAELYIAKVLEKDGTGPDSAILAGVDWALGKACHLVSLSVGVQSAELTCDPVYEAVARRCLKAGMLFMAAAGNDSLRPQTLRPVCRPASCPSIFAVGAVDRHLRIARFSNSTGAPGYAQVDAVAPGVEIYTTTAGALRYGRFSGTSMATPLCAGIAAVIVQNDPDCQGAELWHRLTTFAHRLPLPSTDVGAGMLSIRALRFPQ